MEISESPFTYVMLRQTSCERQDMGNDMNMLMTSRIKKVPKSTFLKSYEGGSIENSLLFPIFPYNTPKRNKDLLNERVFFLPLFSNNLSYLMFDLAKIEAAINQISAEKKIDKKRLVEIIEHAIKTAYKKDYASKDANVNVKLDINTGSVEISVEKTIVEEVTDSDLEISYDDVGGADSGFALGDTVEIDVSDEILTSE